MNNMVKNIVFDMGGVLVDYNPRRCIARYGRNEEDSKLLLEEIFLSVEWVLCDRGALTEAEAAASIRRRLPERLHEDVTHILSHWYEDMPPIPATNELAARLREAGYKLYLLSNAAPSFYNYRLTIPAIRYFDGEFLSCDWNLIKPDPEIYRAFCAHFRLVPSRCFFIDDLPYNMEAAIRCGMQGFAYHGNAPALERAMRDAGIEF